MALSRERLDGEARRRRISFMDLRLRGQRSQPAFPGSTRRRRFFCRRALSLVGRRSLGICSLLASRPAAKSLAAPSAIIYDVVFRSRKLLPSLAASGAMDYSQITLLAAT